MNERILELVKQATTIDYGGERGFDGVNPREIFDKEKFAELIVGECARMVDQEWHLSGAELKEHFGVEE